MCQNVRNAYGIIYGNVFLDLGLTPRLSPRMPRLSPRMPRLSPLTSIPQVLHQKNVLFTACPFCVTGLTLPRHTIRRNRFTLTKIDGSDYSRQTIVD